MGSLLRYKEWWNFMFFSRRENMVFSYTMLKSKIRDHFTSCIWNLKNDEKMELDSDSSIQAEQGDFTDLYSEGKWGNTSVKGKYEKGGWELKINSPQFSANLFYSPESPQKIIENFWDNKFKCVLYGKNRVTGILDAFGQTFEIDTYGCREHTFCDFPRDSFWNWLLALHDDYSLVATRGGYSGYDYKYAVMFIDNQWVDLDPDVDFVIDEQDMLKTCEATSPDISLRIYPMQNRYEYKNIMLGLLVEAHYWELAVRLSGSVTLGDRNIPIDTYGIMTRSRMRW